MSQFATKVLAMEGENKELKVKVYDLTIEIVRAPTHTHCRLFNCRLLSPAPPVNDCLVLAAVVALLLPPCMDFVCPA